jgi:thioredoxin reductase
MASCCSSAQPENTVDSTGQHSMLPVAVIGGGPVGLAAAAHLLECGLEPVLFESGSTIGGAPMDWGHVQMFSPWRYNIDRACRVLLEQHGWTPPDPDSLPTGRELVERYLQPLANLPELRPHLRLRTTVTGIARAHAGKVRDVGRDQQPFDVRFKNTDDTEGRLLAQAVIVATGTWARPNPAGASGLPALGEEAAADRIRYGMPDVLGADRRRYADQRVLVVGSGHSAIGTLINLAVLAEQAPITTVLWAARSNDLTRAYGGGAADQLPERGALGQRLRAHVERGHITLLAPFAVSEIRRTDNGGLNVFDDNGQSTQVDEIVVATGLRPDLSILREVRTSLDPALDCPRVLAPLIDPNVHSCGSVRPHGALELEQPDTGLFLAGMVSYGRAPTFLLATGYEQVRSIAAFIAGDIEAARRVELDLPETGVCSSNLVREDSSACCGGPSPAKTACCSQDADVKEAGLSGCGCPATARTEATETESAL